MAVNRRPHPSSRTADAILVLRKRKCWTSPLSTLHLSGVLYYLAEIPLRSLEYKNNWHFKSYKDFLTFFNSSFHLPRQKNSQFFCLTSSIAMYNIHNLLQQLPCADVWRTISNTGKLFVGTILDISDFLKVTRIANNENYHGTGLVSS